MLTHEDTRPWKCDVVSCDYKSKYKSNLKMHMLTHSNEKRYKCSECDYATKYKSNLSSHMMTHSKETPYACTYCKYETRYKSNLKNHVKSHLKRADMNSNDVSSVAGLPRGRKPKARKEDGGMEAAMGGVPRRAMNMEEAASAHSSTSNQQLTSPRPIGLPDQPQPAQRPSTLSIPMVKEEQSGNNHHSSGNAIDAVVAAVLENVNTASVGP